jgi:hypothetical protein
MACGKRRIKKRRLVRAARKSASRMLLKNHTAIGTPEGNFNTYTWYPFPPLIFLGRYWDFDLRLAARTNHMGATVTTAYTAELFIGQIGFIVFHGYISFWIVRAAHAHT